MDVRLEFTHASEEQITDFFVGFYQVPPLGGPMHNSDDCTVSTAGAHSAAAPTRGHADLATEPGCLRRRWCACAALGALQASSVGVRRHSVAVQGLSLEELAEPPSDETTSTLISSGDGDLALGSPAPTAAGVPADCGQEDGVAMQIQSQSGNGGLKTAAASKCAGTLQSHPSSVTTRESAACLSNTRCFDAEWKQ